ncbi:metal-dependent hydrolase, partial [Candidatus Woesearchaeota archaeon]|nr:metal-dependent hydrolase [Candidatus Woesearchaeota archaeon]
MRFKTHLAFGLLMGLLFLEYSNEKDKILFIAFILLGSALPDIDTASSKLGSKIWPMSRLIEIFMGHRGIFHSIWLIILVPGIVYLYLSKIYGTALFVGYFS